MNSKLWLSFSSILIVLFAFVDGLALESDSNATDTEFRIDTAVYQGNQKQPTSQNITLFSDGMVFDFSMTFSESEPSEITIYDSRKKSFALLDTKRKLKFEIRQSQLVSIVEGLRAETNQNTETRFLTTDQYNEQHDVSTGWHSLSNDVITYRFKGKQLPNPQLVQAYNEFVDQYTLLGATDPRRLPPFSRIRLNRVIQKYKVIPTEIQLSVRETEVLRQSFSLTSKHTLVEGLADSDRQRIKTAKLNQTTFAAVNMARYRDLSLPAASVKSDDLHK